LRVASYIILIHDGMAFSTWYWCMTWHRCLCGHIMQWGFFFCQICVRAKVIHNNTLGKLSHIWIQAKYESNWLLNYGYSSGSELWLLKISKNILIHCNWFLYIFWLYVTNKKGLTLMLFVFGKTSSFNYKKMGLNHGFFFKM
jgi:hypothetical protein